MKLSWHDIPDEGTIYSGGGSGSNQSTVIYKERTKPGLYQCIFMYSASNVGLVETAGFM